MAAGKCGANKSDGTKCGNMAGQGTDHPGWGKCVFHYGSSPAGRKFAARQSAAAWGLANAIEVDPDDALLMMVHCAAGAVKWCADRIASQDVEDPASPWIQVYGEERDRLARTSKMAIDTGIAERQVTLAEQEGEMIAIVIRQILDDLELSPEQKLRSTKIVRNRLLALPVASGE